MSKSNGLTAASRAKKDRTPTPVRSPSWAWAHSMISASGLAPSEPDRLPFSFDSADHRVTHPCTEIRREVTV